jgi:hypothetical protein
VGFLLRMLVLLGTICAAPAAGIHEATQPKQSGNGGRDPRPSRARVKGNLTRSTAPGMRRSRGLRGRTLQLLPRTAVRSIPHPIW